MSRLNLQIYIAPILMRPVDMPIAARNLVRRRALLAHTLRINCRKRLDIGRSCQNRAPTTYPAHDMPRNRQRVASPPRTSDGFHECPMTRQPV